MNPLEFYSSKVEKDLQNFISDVQKVTQIMGITLIKGADLVGYQLKGVAQTWYKLWKNDRGVDIGDVTQTISSKKIQCIHHQITVSQLGWD